MLAALTNASYGFDPASPRSRGGADGLFLVDRTFKPPNSMMAKLFVQFIDKPDPLVPALVRQFGAPLEEWIPVRLVSHHLRLLGVLVRAQDRCCLILVDHDVGTK